MKKLLFMSLLSLIGFNAIASDCSIFYSSSNDLDTAIGEKPFEFDRYETVCQLLKSANAKVSLSSASNINNQQTTATVIATVMDKNLPILSYNYHSAMGSSPERTTAMERELLMDAVNGALNGIDQSDIDSLNANRKKLGVKTYPVLTQKK